MKKHNAIAKQPERGDKPVVIFREEKQFELIIKDELKKIRNKVL
jgi:hypothetical protein